MSSFAPRMVGAPPSADVAGIGPSKRFHVSPPSRDSPRHITAPFTTSGDIAAIGPMQFSWNATMRCVGSAASTSNDRTNPPYWNVPPMFDDVVNRGLVNRFVQVAPASVDLNSVGGEP